MKFRLFFLLFATKLCMAQTALYNAGNIRIHDGGNLGFHTDLINDSPFSENLGLAGFYGDQNLQVSGALAPAFYDVEIVNPGGVLLNTSLNVENNANFITGDFQTSRLASDAYLNFVSNSFYSGENDASKVDGYAAISG
ncbi:MAG: gliding motility-associated C-terminal domain-containing protein, partial [Eudoraea sp.]|nr:gliding motility-associated C-terminal domain-containing protein [Eudoraea sp.]